jgi:hypothetical protein
MIIIIPATCPPVSIYIIPAGLFLSLLIADARDGDNLGIRCPLHNLEISLIEPKDVT